MKNTQTTKLPFLFKFAIWQPLKRNTSNITNNTHTKEIIFLFCQEVENNNKYIRK